MYDVFISHSSKDTATAQALCSFLESNGLKCWIAPRDVKPGHYAESIIEGISDSPVFLLLLSADSNQSSNVIHELDVAFNSAKTIIPFVLDDTELSMSFKYYLAGIHRIMGQPVPEDQFEYLRERIEIAKKESIPAAPVKTNPTTPPKAHATEKTGSLSEKSSEGRSRYDFLQNDNGELLLIIRERKGPATNPVMVIDSDSPYALLYRSPKSSALFDDITETGKSALMKAGELRVVEITDDNGVVREYKAPIRIVKDVKAMMD